MASDKHFLYHLIISQLHHDGFALHAGMLEQAALNTSHAIGPSDRLKQMLSMCAHTVREVDNFFEGKPATPNFEEDEIKSTSYFPERLSRSSTPSNYHSFARRRLSAAKRHSFMSMNRSKQHKSSPKTLYSITCPKTSHVPIIYSSASEDVPTSNSLQNLFSSPTQNSSPLFGSGDEKVKSVEAVRVLQNIFQQKRDMIPVVTTAESDPPLSMSQDLNSLINATSGVLNDSTTSPTGSLHSPVEPEEPRQGSPKSPDRRELSTSPPGSNRSAFSPPTRTLSVTSATTVENMVTDDPQDCSDENITVEEEERGPLVNHQISHESHEDQVHSPIEAVNVKEETDENTDCSTISDTSKISYPQEIIDQLSSLSASNIGNIQNLANSLSSSLNSEANLTAEGGLAGLSSLASSLNLSNVTSLEGQSLSSRGAGFDFLSRLEGDSPSMLSMMSSQGRGGSGGSSTTPPQPGRRFQCPHCNKCYASYDCLSRHKRIHTGANKKTCPTCFRLFFRADHFKTHTSTCSKKQLPSPPSSLSPGSPEKKIGSSSGYSPRFSYEAYMPMNNNSEDRVGKFFWTTQFVNNGAGERPRPGMISPTNGMSGVPQITNIAGAVRQANGI